jgi:hypothetical protein
VQSRQRVDIHASLGSVSTVDLVVRGDRYARRAHAYSSHCGDRMMFEPNTTFQLVPGAFNRVAVQFSPYVAGTRYVKCSILILYFSISLSFMFYFFTSVLPLFSFLRLTYFLLPFNSHFNFVPILFTTSFMLFSVSS